MCLPHGTEQASTGCEIDRSSQEVPERSSPHGTASTLSCVTTEVVLNEARSVDTDGKSPHFLARKNAETAWDRAHGRYIVRQYPIYREGELVLTQSDLFCPRRPTTRCASSLTGAVDGLVDDIEHTYNRLDKTIAHL